MAVKTDLSSFCELRHTKSNPWPVIFLLTVRNYVGERASDFRDVLLWFGAIFLGFIVLLGINATL